MPGDERIRDQFIGKTNSPRASSFPEAGDKALGKALQQRCQPASASCSAPPSAHPEHRNRSNRSPSLPSSTKLTGRYTCLKLVNWGKEVLHNSVICSIPQKFARFLQTKPSLAQALTPTASTLYIFHFSREKKSISSRQ